MVIPPVKFPIRNLGDGKLKWTNRVTRALYACPWRRVWWLPLTVLSVRPVTWRKTFQHGFYPVLGFTEYDFGQG